MSMTDEVSVAVHAQRTYPLAATNWNKAKTATREESKNFMLMHKRKQCRWYGVEGLLVVGMNPFATRQDLLWGQRLDDSIS